MGELEVHVTTPEREVWVGEATMVIAHAESGEVGILPGHIPMLVPLAIGLLAIHTDAGVTRAVVDGGFLHVAGSVEYTRVDVLAEHAELAAEVDPAAAERRRDEALRRMEHETSAEARAELAKALARVRIGG
jgi:F-type H+-transporting ATPase subunit epsilon